MNNQASRVAVVNQIARQLMHSGHPSEKEIRAQQDKLNTRYAWYQQCGEGEDESEGGGEGEGGGACPHLLSGVFLHRFTGRLAWMS